jgi:hypothetical protein
VPPLPESEFAQTMRVRRRRKNEHDQDSRGKYESESYKSNLEQVEQFAINKSIERRSVRFAVREKERQQLMDEP